MEYTKSDLEIIGKEFEELRLASLKRCSSQEEYDDVLRAFEFACEAHKGVRRKSGEPYIIHPIEVANIVVNEIGLGHKSIVAALLHDVVEDTHYTVEDIANMFGEKIASLVDGLTKIKAAMDLNEGSTLQAENFKRIILTLNDDIRVVLIKLADRLHNIRTIGSMPDYKKDKILSETMYIFIPLAHRLGLYNIKSEMENIWLKTRNPEVYEDIVRKTQGVIASKSEALDKFIEPISAILKQEGFDNFNIYKRTKNPYSIWKKMQTKHVEFDDIFDIYGIRIIFTPKEGYDERQQCWYIYALISGLYSSKMDRIRDWVTHPKSNGYEALHCTLMSAGSGWVEVQIRSERMNEIAEKGVAAHWIYKKQGQEGGKYTNENEIENWLNMVRGVLENPDSNALEFLDQFHETLLNQEIYVFTPKGESKSMQKGATALDFAYSIHTKIGNKAIAAKINHKLSPLSTVLRNGDQVEIITAENQKPQPEWLSFLKTQRARNYLYEALKDEIDDSITKGREMLESELAKSGIKLHSNVMKKLLIEFKLNTKEEFYNKIATGVISLKDLDKILKKNSENKRVSYWSFKLFSSGPDNILDTEDDVEMTDEEIKEKIIKTKLDKNRDFILTGKDKGAGKDMDSHITYRIADCCYPIPGDNIVGFISENGEVVVHKKTCPEAVNLASLRGDRIVNAKWSKDTIASFLARIRIFGADRMGILNEVTKCTTLDMAINIRKVSIATHDGIFEGYIDCYVRSTEDLNNLMNHVRKISGVESVNRIDIRED